MIPEIADYEVRRELLRAGKDRGLIRLDALKGLLGYARITTPVMLKAAEFWATARKIGRQSADDASLDADMILVAQAAALVHDRDETVIATTKSVIWRCLHPRASGAKLVDAGSCLDGVEVRRLSGPLGSQELSASQGRKILIRELELLAFLRHPQPPRNRYPS